MNTPSSSTPNWALTQEEKNRYLQIFTKLPKDPENCISGADCKATLIKSQLNIDDLKKVWQLSDTKSRGKLDLNEFCICMHLIYISLAGHKLPDTLPKSLIDSVVGSGQPNPVPETDLNTTGLSALSSSTLAGSVSNMMPQDLKTGPPGPPARPALPNMSNLSNMSVNVGSSATDNMLKRTSSVLSSNSLASNNSNPSLNLESSLNTSGNANTLNLGLMGPPAINNTPHNKLLHGSTSKLASSTTSIRPEKESSPYYIPNDENKNTYKKYFESGQTVDGFIEGVTAKNLFLQSSLPPTFLAQIWSLVDTEQSGRLNENQFILAMHLLRLKVKENIDPPNNTPLSKQEIDEFCAGAALREFEDPEDLSETLQAIQEFTRQKAQLAIEVKQKEAHLNNIKADTEKLEASINKVDEVLSTLEGEKIEWKRKSERIQNELTVLKAQRSDVVARKESADKNIVELNRKKYELESNQRDGQVNKEKLTIVLNRISARRAELSTEKHALSDCELNIKKVESQINSIKNELSVTQGEKENIYNNVERIKTSINKMKNGEDIGSLNSLTENVVRSNNNTPNNIANGMGMNAASSSVTPLSGANGGMVQSNTSSSVGKTILPNSPMSTSNMASPVNLPNLNDNTLMSAPVNEPNNMFTASSENSGFPADFSSAFTTAPTPVVQQFSNRSTPISHVQKVNLVAKTSIGSNFSQKDPFSGGFDAFGGSQATVDTSPFQSTVVLSNASTTTITQTKDPFTSTDQNLDPFNDPKSAAASDSQNFTGFEVSFNDNDIDKSVQNAKPNNLHQPSASPFGDDAWGAAPYDANSNGNNQIGFGEAGQSSRKPAGFDAFGGNPWG